MRIARIAVLLLTVALGLLLAACGGPRKYLGPPTLSVQEFELVDGHYWARVRIDSPSSVPVVLSSFDWRFSLAGTNAGSGSARLDVTLPPVGGDIVRVDLGPESALPRLASLGKDNTLAYVLEGELQCSEPSVRFPLRYEGQLRPTPGKPGSFR
jgi:hypothetical protein